MVESMQTGELNAGSGAHTRSPATATRYRRLRVVPFRIIDDASDLLARLFRNYPGQISLRLWNGSIVNVGVFRVDDPAPAFTLVFRNPDVICRLVLGRDPLRLAAACARGDVDIEGDVFAALSLKEYLKSLHLPLSDRLSGLLAALRVMAFRQ
jgi:cyclopropane-fatty-acyl-phospholipid synthase